MGKRPRESVARGGGGGAAASQPTRRRKKKGRPSLLDLQRRSLRLQNPKADSGRSATRRNPNPNPNSGYPSSSSSDSESGCRRREKRLKTVLLSGDGEEVPERNNAAKATGAHQGDASDCGPATPLPDKKLLLFILDRLQKKDTYGVFSEPVDPEELPDYHEIIEHPMDFATIREKLEKGEYANLEQFEEDVFLITSNAMRYNAPDTIYFRQARSIQELAKKNFENLRQASDDDEAEPQPVVRRGRPPNKTKKIVSKPAENASSDFTNTKLTNSEDNHEIGRKGLAGDRSGDTNISTRDSYCLRQNETFGWLTDKKSERNGDYSATSKYGKKNTILDENRRRTYKQPQLSSCGHEHPVVTALDGERKLLVPVGLHQGYAYARSLARFAAKLGPIGWNIAAKKIQRVLPPGTSFGPGWVVDGEPPQTSQPPLISTCPHPSSQLDVPSGTTPSKYEELSQRSEPFSNGDTIEEGCMARTHPVASTSANFDKSSDFASKVPKYENGVSISCHGAESIGPTSPFQHVNPCPEIRSAMNGFNAAPNIIAQCAAKGLFGSDMQMTHAQVLGMFSGINGRINGYIRSQNLDAERAKTAQNSYTGNTSSPLPDTDHDSQGSLQGLSPHQKPDPVPPNLNARAHSEPPVSGKVVDLKQPDLALQL